MKIDPEGDIPIYGNNLTVLLLSLFLSSLLFSFPFLEHRGLSTTHHRPNKEERSRVVRTLYDTESDELTGTANLDNLDLSRLEKKREGHPESSL